MPDSTDTASSGGPAFDAAAVLAAARKALGRGDGWFIEPSLYNRFRRDCDALEIPGDTLSETKALREALAEITGADVRRRIDASYSGSCPDQTLYQCVWASARFSCEMYLKFALVEDDTVMVEIFTFHQSTTQRGKS